jgi:PAS domain S-box-containing protein
MTSTGIESPESLNGQAPHERAEPVAQRRSWRNSERLMPVLATVPLFAGIFALALGTEHPEDAVSVLYTIPIAIIAIERGPVAGLAAAAAALGLFAADVAISDEPVSALAFVTRGIGFGVLGGLLGHYATSLRAANVEVAAREEQLLSILDNTTAVIYMKDRKGRYILVNRRFEDLFHKSSDSVMGKTDRDVFPQYMADAFMANDRRVLKELQPIEFEEEAPQDDGPHTYISVKFPLVRPGEREAYAICGISTDISGRKVAEKELRDSKDRFRQIIDTSNEAFISINEAGEIIHWNRAAEKTFGWPARKAVGQRISELILPERYRALHEEGLRRYLESGNAAILDKRIEMAGRDRSGREFPIELTITAVRVQGGHRFHAFVREIGDHGRADQSYLVESEPTGSATSG